MVMRTDEVKAALERALMLERLMTDADAPVPPELVGLSVATKQRADKATEFESAFPELAPMINEARARFDALVTEVTADYETHRGLASQKDFALAVKSSRCSGSCFQLRAGKVPSVRHSLAQMPIDSLLRILGYKDQ